MFQTEPQAEFISPIHHSYIPNLIYMPILYIIAEKIDLKRKISNSFIQNISIRRIDCIK